MRLIEQEPIIFDNRTQMNADNQDFKLRFNRRRRLLESFIEFIINVRHLII